MKSHPALSVLGLAVVLAGAGVGSYLAVSGGGSGSTAAVAVKTTTTTSTVSTGTFKKTVSASGTLSPADDETYSFSSSGVVTKVYVTEGEAVKSGQALARIDSASLAADLAAAKATVASNKAKVSADVSDSVSSAQLAADKASLAASRTARDSAKSALAGATLRAGFDGVVASVGLTAGESVAAGGGGSSGTGGGSSGTSGTASGTGIQVISTHAWVVNATVDSTAVDELKAGNQAELSIDNVSGTVYGTVSSVSILSSSSSGTASYPVLIKVTGSPSGLHDGQSVTASLIYKQLADVIVIDSGALHTNSDGTRYVEKVVNGKVVNTTVQVGDTSGTQAQITSGLSAGDTIQIQQTTITRSGNAGNGGTGTGNGGTGNGGTFQLPGGGSFQIPAGGGNFPNVGGN